MVITFILQQLLRFTPGECVLNGRENQTPQCNFVYSSRTNKHWNSPRLTESFSDDRCSKQLYVKKKERVNHKTVLLLAPKAKKDPSYIREWEENIFSCQAHHSFVDQPVTFHLTTGDPYESVYIILYSAILYALYI